MCTLQQGYYFCYHPHIEIIRINDRQLRTFMGETYQELGTYHIQVRCLERILKSIHMGLQCRFKDFDHIIGDIANKAIRITKSRLFSHLLITFGIDPGIIVLKKAEWVFAQDLSVSLCIDIFGLIILILDLLSGTSR